MEERTGFRTRRVEELFAVGFSIGLSIGFLAALFEPRRAAERKPATAARMSPLRERVDHPMGNAWWSPDSGCRAGITEFGARARRPAAQPGRRRRPVLAGRGAAAAELPRPTVC